MAQFITLTRYPNRQSGMGLSLSSGEATPPTPPPPPPSSYTPYVKIWTASGVTEDTFSGDTIPEGYYSGRTDILAVEVCSGITIGGAEVWKDCTNISAVTLNGSGTIVAHSFQGCTSLSEVSICDRYTRLEGWVFSGCTSLSSITIPDSVTLIGGYTFQFCSNLEEVTLGSGITQLNTQLFQLCGSLTSITCYATTAPTLGTRCLYGARNNRGTLYVPTGSDYSSWFASGQLNNSYWTTVYI